MYTIDKYLSDVRLLASSLVIKHHNIGIVINQGLTKQYGTAPSYEYKKWKYYLNISGVKHSTNSNVVVKLLETGVTVPLTKEILNTHQATRLDLDSRGINYNALVSEYPNDILYINGCILPVDIDTAIAAKNGTILEYSKQYIEPQEYSLIRELSTQLDLFFNRWYNVDYNITDELYMASVLAVMYAAIPNMILTIRLEDASTVEAHSFHMDHFFRSHLDIADNITKLKPSTVMWLYKNLPRLMNDVGSNETLNTIIEKVFTANRIGVGSYTLITDGHIIDNMADVTKSTFTVKDPVFRIDKLNTYYNNPDKILTTSTVISNMVSDSVLDNISTGTSLETLTQSEIHKLVGTDGVNQKTKILDFGTINLFKTYNNNLLETIVDTWLVLAGNGKYTMRNRFIDPNTKIVYDMTPYTGVLLFYYLLFNKFGTPDPIIPNIKYNNYLDLSITKSQLLDNLLPAIGNDYIADIIVANLPIPTGAISTLVDLNNQIDTQIGLYKKLWTTDSNVNNTFLSSNIKRMVKRLYVNGEVSLTPNNTPVSLKSLLVAAGVDITITDTYDTVASMTDLFKLFTGYDLQEDTIIREMYGNFKVLLDKLTSYSIQTVAPIINDANTTAPYTTISVANNVNGYIQVRNAEITRLLEINNSTIIAGGNDFIETCESVDLTPPAITLTDVFNKLQLISHGNTDSITTATLRESKTFAEILSSSYIKYVPYTISDSNTNSKPVPVPEDVGVVPNINTHPRDHDVYTNANTNSITTEPVTTVEVVGSDHTVFSPITGSDGNSGGPTIPTAKDGGVINGVTTTPRDQALHATGSNTQVSTAPTATVEVMGTDYINYAPAGDIAGNNVNIATPTAKDNGISPNITTTPRDQALHATGSNTQVSTSPTATVEVSGSTYTNYIPAGSAVGNSGKIATPVPVDAGVPPATTINPRDSNIQVTASNAQVTTTPTTVVEIIGSDYKP